MCVCVWVWGREREIQTETEIEWRRKIERQRGREGEKRERKSVQFLHVEDENEDVLCSISPTCCNIILLCTTNVLFAFYVILNKHILTHAQHNAVTATHLLARLFFFFIKANSYGRCYSKDSTQHHPNDQEQVTTTDKQALARASSHTNRGWFLVTVVFYTVLWSGLTVTVQFHLYTDFKCLVSKV